MVNGLDLINQMEAFVAESDPSLKLKTILSHPLIRARKALESVQVPEVEVNLEAPPAPAPPSKAKKQKPKPKAKAKSSKKK